MKTHPWTGIRPHVCSGITVDESDALILLRRKRQDIVKLKSMPKDAYDELMQEVDSVPDWDEDKRRRVCALIGTKQRNERTFQRCLLKGRRIAAGTAAAFATTNGTDNYDSDNNVETNYLAEKPSEMKESTLFTFKEEFLEENDFALATATAKGNELIQCLMGNGLGACKFSFL